MAPAAVAPQQEQQQQQQRVAASSAFEEYILDLQRRIIQAGCDGGHACGFAVLHAWLPPIWAVHMLLLPSVDTPLRLLAHAQSHCMQRAEELDGSGARFEHDRWSRSPDNPNAGYGITSGALGLKHLRRGGFH